jgi:hypothetical protein
MDSVLEILFGPPEFSEDRRTVRCNGAEMALRFVFEIEITRAISAR